MEVKKIIKQRGYTLEKIAEEWRDKDGVPRPVTKGALSKSINNNPTLQTLQTIANIIGCKVGDFFRDEITQEDTPTILRCPECGCSLHVEIKKEAVPL